MTQNEIIEMARESGLETQDGFSESVFYFAKLVAEHEREECIAIAESKRHAPHFVLTSMPSQNGTAVDIANLIRARGQA